MHQPAELRRYFSMQKGTAAKESLHKFFRFQPAPSLQVDITDAVLDADLCPVGLTELLEIS